MDFIGKMPSTMYVSRDNCYMLIDCILYIICDFQVVAIEGMQKIT